MYVHEPPSVRSRLPCGVSIASYATDPTTTSDIVLHCTDTIKVEIRKRLSARTSYAYLCRCGNCLANLSGSSLPHQPNPQRCPAGLRGSSLRDRPRECLPLRPTSFPLGLHPSGRGWRPDPLVLVIDGHRSRPVAQRQ